LLTGPYLSTHPGKCASDQAEIARAQLRNWISALFVKFKMPKSACSVEKQKVGTGEKERRPGEKTIFVENV
jgi:hypothetical protein